MTDTNVENFKAIVTESDTTKATAIKGILTDTKFKTLLTGNNASDAKEILTGDVFSAIIADSSALAKLKDAGNQSAIITAITNAQTTSGTGS